MNDNKGITDLYVLPILQIVGVTAGLDLVLSWFGGGLNLLSNFFFFSSAILIIFSVFPLFSDGGIKGFNKIRKEGLVLELNEEEILKKKQEKTKRIRTIYRFGWAGIFSFILSVLTSSIK